MFKPEFCCLFATHLRFLSPSLPPCFLFLELHLCWFRMGWSSTTMSLLGKKGAGHWYTIIIWVWKLYPNMNQIWMGRVMINPKIWGTPCSDKLVCLFALLWGQSLSSYQPASWKEIYIHISNYIYMLVGGWPTTLKKMSSSVGMMTFPIWWERHKNVPNHQPGYIYPLVI